MPSNQTTTPKQLRLVAKGFYVFLQSVYHARYQISNQFTQEFIQSMTGLNSEYVKSLLNELVEEGYIQYTAQYTSSLKAKTQTSTIEFLEDYTPLTDARHIQIFNTFLTMQGLGLLEYLHEVANQGCVYKTVREIMAETGTASGTVQKELKRLVELGFINKVKSPKGKAVHYELVEDVYFQPSQLLCLPCLARDMFIQEQTERSGFKPTEHIGTIYNPDMRNFYGRCIAKNMPLEIPMRDSLIKPCTTPSPMYTHEMTVGGHTIYGTKEDLGTLLEIEYFNEVKPDIGLLSLYLKIFEQTKNVSADAEIYIGEPLTDDVDYLHTTVEQIKMDLDALKLRGKWDIYIR